MFSCCHAAGHPANSSLLDGTSDSLGSVGVHSSTTRERARTTHNDTGIGSSINESPGSPRHHAHEERHTPTSLGSPHRGKWVSIIITKYGSIYLCSTYASFFKFARLGIYVRCGTPLIWIQILLQIECKTFSGEVNTGGVS